MNYLITTTINLPTLLHDYVQDAIAHQHDFQIVVIGDQKTPTATQSFCEQLPHTTYLGPADQKKLFGHLPLYPHLPFNSVQRRNLAYLFCLQQGISSSDTIITIDDDNFLQQSNYVGQHLANHHQTAETVTATTPTWYNPLTNFYPEAIVPRGFSIFHRFSHPSSITTKFALVPVAVSAGLWETNPDVDALTNLIGLPGPCCVTRTKPLVLGKNILCPFNTQNTAYFSSFWLTAFLSPFLGRYDDIFSSFITKRITDHLGFNISFGPPIVQQKRNPHDFYRDLRQEIHGYSTTDSFVSFLYSVSLTSTSIIDCYQQLADAISRQYQNHSFDSALHNLSQPWSITKMTEGMKLWLDTIDTLNVPTQQFYPTKALQHG